MKPTSLLALFLFCLSAAAQTLIPPGAVQEIREVIGNRTEAAVVLGGDYGAMGGIYTFRGGKVASLDVAKLGGGGDIAAERSVGIGEMSWAPVLQGNLGHLTARNDFESGFLDGNTSESEIWAVEGGGGARFYFNEHWNIAPTISGIYGHIENDLKARNPNGQLVKAIGSGTLVDWNVDTWSVVPSFEVRYEITWKRTIFEVSSHYNFFHTESFSSSSPVVSIAGDSHTWENKLDVDIPLGWHLFTRELHTGGFVSRTELFGGVSDALREDHFYTLNGRLVLDLLGKVWGMRWIGLGASYFFGDRFNGWSAGIDFRLQF